MTKASNEFEALVDLFSDVLVDTVEGMPLADAPFGAVKLTPDEQMQRYHQIRDDANAWNAMVMEHGLPETLRYARTMERRHQKTMTETENGRTSGTESTSYPAVAQESVGRGY